jgi:hypothetical protein
MADITWTREKVKAVLADYHALERAAEKVVDTFDDLWGRARADFMALDNPAPFYTAEWPRMSDQWPDNIEYQNWAGERNDSSVPWFALWTPSWFEEEKARAKAARETAEGRRKEEEERRELARLQAKYTAIAAEEATNG